VTTAGFTLIFGIELGMNDACWSEGIVGILLLLKDVHGEKGSVQGARGGWRNRLSIHGLIAEAINPRWGAPSFLHDVVMVLTPGDMSCFLSTSCSGDFRWSRST
jgi:hypothetical protein